MERKERGVRGLVEGFWDPLSFGRERKSGGLEEFQTI